MYINFQIPRNTHLVNLSRDPYRIPKSIQTGGRYILIELDEIEIEVVPIYKLNNIKLWVFEIVIFVII